jgi:hypothetical protein
MEFMLNNGAQAERESSLASMHASPLRDMEGCLSVLLENGDPQLHASLIEVHEKAV